MWSLQAPDSLNVKRQVFEVNRNLSSFVAEDRDLYLLESFYEGNLDGSPANASSVPHNLCEFHAGVSVLSHRGRVT